MKKYLVALQDERCQTQITINEHTRCFDDWHEANEYCDTINNNQEVGGWYFYKVIRIPHDTLV